MQDDQLKKLNEIYENILHSIEMSQQSFHLNLQEEDDLFKPEPPFVLSSQERDMSVEFLKYDDFKQTNNV